MLYDIPSQYVRLPPSVYLSDEGVPCLLPDHTVGYIPALPGRSYLIVGMTGSGKSTLTRELTCKLLNEKPDTLGVFFQVKPDDFSSRFMTTDSKIILYRNTRFFDRNVFHWNMIREIRQAADPEAELRQLGESLFGKERLNDPHNGEWAEAAMNTFLGFLRVLVNSEGEAPSNAQVLRQLRGLSGVQLLRFLSRHPDNHPLLISTFVFDPNHPDTPYNMPRKGEDTLFFMNKIVSRFGGDSFMAEEGQDTLHDFLHSRGRRLFIQHDLSQEAASRPLEVYLLTKLINDKMSPSAGVKAPVLMVLDEADKVGSDFGAGKAATLGRGFGLQLILSTQSTESLYALMPPENREHAGNATLAGFPVKIVFQCGDAQTISTMQSLFGTDRFDIAVPALSRREAPTVRSEREPLVTDLELASLKTGECYVKVASDLPQKVYMLLP